MKQLFGPLGSPNYCEYAEHIHSSGETLLHRINDIIELSSIEAREKQLILEPVDADFLIEEALQTVRRSAIEKGVRLTLSDPDRKQRVITSVAATHEILFRLLDNAIKFSHPGGEVEIVVEPHNNDVAIRICDHGIGIEPGAIQSLGRPFAQVEDHLRRTHGGLGLGLAISYGLAKVLNISISIESSLGQGTAVTLRIPEARAEDLELRSAA